MAGGMEAENDFGPWGTFDAEALGANGNPAIGADLERGAYAPDLRPPGAARGWAQDRPFFFLGPLPGSWRGHAQFAMDFMGVARQSQSVDGGLAVSISVICSLAKYGGSRPCQNGCSRSIFPLA